MNRDVLDALGAVAGDFYFDALNRYPALLLDPSEPPDDEALVVWRILMAIDELAVAVTAAIEFDDAQHVVEIDPQEDLPF